MAKSKKQKKSTRGEWDRFERELLRATPAATRKARAAIGDVTPQTEPAEDEVLRRLAERSQLSRGRAPPMGNVVFLHGITGADLAVAEGAEKPSGVWVSIPKMIFGGIRKLKLAADGKSESNQKLRVVPTGVNKQFYARAIVALRAHWNVEPFAYDWRKDIDEASDRLAEFIEARFPGEPVHLVAHSMGGLVARNFIRRHAKMWKTMRDPELVRGGRLVMLGTPNYGSYAIAQVLTGKDALLARLERFDLKNNLAELLDVTNSFLGTYMLLPAFDKLPGTLQQIYERGTWGGTPAISQQHLNRTLEFYRTLDTPATVDPERMVYVAGVNQTTISSLRVQEPGEFEYSFTLAGDGRVPHTLGLLSGVRTYYVDEVHGDLARNEHILRELDSLLQSGKSSLLGTTAETATRGVAAIAAAPSSRTYRTGADAAALDILEEMASRTRGAGSADVLDDRDRQIAADAIIHAALGARTPTVARAVAATPKAPPKTRAQAASMPKLRVGVRYGRIEAFKSQVVVVGHYRGVKPVKAIGAINAKLDDWIGRAVRRGMISGHVGETFFVPTENTDVGADGVIIGGMGDFGRFNPSALRQIMSNVAQAAAALQLKEVATVLIGSGEGNLTPDRAIKHLLEGFSAGLAELRGEKPNAPLKLESIHIVEFDPERYLVLDQEVRWLLANNPIPDVRIDYQPLRGEERTRARRDHISSARKRFQDISKAEQPQRTTQKFDEVRITIEFDREHKVFNFSALTDSALVPTRVIPVTVEVAEETARLLASAESRPRQVERGRTLFDYTFPQDFETLLDNDASIRFVLDPTSAAIPWEMACLASNSPGGEPRWLGLSGRLTRQFKTLLSQSVGLIVPRNEKVRALVIADPAPEPQWQLPGARAEGRAVAKLLRDANRRSFGGTEIDIVVDEYIGPDEAGAADLVGKIISGQYDLVHFAGHGDYNSDDPGKSGWVLGGSRFVTATDIDRMRKAPWLIVANACYSGAVRQGEPYPSLDVARRRASIAEAFMNRGTRNYLGTGWTVDDAQAESFAKLLYGQLLTNTSLGEAVSLARDGIFKEKVGATWGAYQFYGNPAERLIPSGNDGQAADVRKPKRKKSPTRAAKSKAKKKGK
jgi:CHAT domain-containing protein/pimeloyl-ACP methyl ester carboxylesterase